MTRGIRSLIIINHVNHVASNQCVVGLHGYIAVSTVTTSERRLNRIGIRGVVGDPET